MSEKAKHKITVKVELTTTISPIIEIFDRMTYNVEITYAPLAGDLIELPGLERSEVDEVCHYILEDRIEIAIVRVSNLHYTSIGFDVINVKRDDAGIMHLTETQVAKAKAVHASLHDPLVHKLVAHGWNYDSNRETHGMDKLEFGV